MDNQLVPTIRVAFPNESLIDCRSDALVCPCDVEITRSSTATARAVFAKAGPDLLKESLAIGYCEIGNAVITKGYGLSSKHVIFLPVVNTDDTGEKINRLTLHQALRSVLTLANAYSVGTLAIPVITLNHKRAKTLFKKLVGMFAGNDDDAGPDESQKEFTDILTSVSSEFSNTPIKEIVVYPGF